MWYVSKLYFAFGEVYFADNFTEDNIVMLLIHNTETNGVVHITNSSLRVYGADDDTIYVDFHDAENFREVLKANGLSFVFGINFDDYFIFSTTSFGMKLYDIIDIGNESVLSDDESVISSYLLYNDFNVFTDSSENYITLDRIVLNQGCQFTGDKIIISDDREMIKQEYIVLDRLKFTKLITLGSKE